MDCSWLADKSDQPNRVQASANGEQNGIPCGSQDEDLDLSTRCLSRIFPTRLQHRTWVVGLCNENTASNIAPGRGHVGRCVNDANLRPRFASLFSPSQPFRPLPSPMSVKTTSVRRAGVTDAIHALTGRGLIKAVRGTYRSSTVTDWPRMPMAVTVSRNASIKG